MDTQGYNTDIPYTTNYFESLAPAMLKTAAAISGFPSPSIKKPFTYLELGCGHAISLLIFAATNPHGAFYGVDFIPKHIELARKIAKECGITNITFFESSFEDLNLNNIPNCDFIVAHGLISWINNTVLKQVRMIVDKKLKRNGIHYVSYNAYPGWGSAAPLHELAAHDIANDTDLNTPQRLQKNFALIDLLIKKQAKGFRDNSEVIKRFDNIKKSSSNYLIHEFMHNKVSGFYFREIADFYAEIDLAYASNMFLYKNYTNLHLPGNFIPFVKQAPSVTAAQRLIDFIENTDFRMDIFMKNKVVSKPDLDDTHLFDDLFLTSLAPTNILNNGVTLRHRRHYFNSQIDKHFRRLLPNHSLLLRDVISHDSLKKHAAADVFESLKVFITLRCATPCTSARLTENEIKHYSNATVGKLNFSMLNLYIKQQLNTVPLASPVVGAAIWMPIQSAKLTSALMLSDGDVEQAWVWILNHTFLDKKDNIIKQADDVKKALLAIKTNQLPRLQQLGVCFSET